MRVALLLALLWIPEDGFAQQRGGPPSVVPPSQTPRRDPWSGLDATRSVRQRTIELEADAGEKLEYRFPVSMTGMISIAARWSGGPLVVRLDGPLPQPIVRRGDKKVRIRARASSEGIAKTTLWTLSFEPDRAAAAIHGTLELTHPAGNEAELKSLYARFSAEQGVARIHTLERLADELRRDLDERRAAFDRESDGTRELRVLRCPQWNLQSEAKIEAKTSLDGFNCSGSGISLFGMARYGSPVSGVRGEDLYFPTFRLQNGWSVDSIFFRAVVSREGEADAKLVESARGGDMPSIRVRWWATPDDSVHYVLLVTIAGPRGTAYE